jgi:hypothetical protein
MNAQMKYKMGLLLLAIIYCCYFSSSIFVDGVFVQNQENDYCKWWHAQFVPLIGYLYLIGCLFTRVCFSCIAFFHISSIR